MGKQKKWIHCTWCFWKQVESIIHILKSNAKWATSKVEILYNKCFIRSKKQLNEIQHNAKSSCPWSRGLEVIACFLPCIFCSSQLFYSKHILLLQSEKDLFKCSGKLTKKQSIAAEYKIKDWQWKDEQRDIRRMQTTTWLRHLTM